MANIALKTSMKTDLIEMIKGNLSESNRYYFFVSKVLPYEDDAATTTIAESDSNPPSIRESTRSVYDAMRSILFMKRISSDNLRIVIARRDWASGTIYDEYSETTDMSGKAYYVMTSEYNVYKCLKRGSVSSTVMPTGKSSSAISLVDGYTWKYIYTVPEDYLGFITLDYIPVFVGNEKFPDQRLVESVAKPASIDRISIDSTLSPEFPKAFRGSGKFCTNIPSFFADTGRIANVVGSTYITLDVAGEIPSDQGNSYFNNYAIHVISGSGIGQYFRILNFYKAGSGSSYYYANVHPSIDRPLVPGNSVLKMVPYVVVDGDGEDAVVIPSVSSGQKIFALNLIKPGINYTYAKPRVVSEAGSAEIGSQVLQFNDSISASLSIPIGHGANAIKELGGANLMIAVDIESVEGGKISARNDYRQFGIVKNPSLYGGITLVGSEEIISLNALIKKEASKKDAYTVATFPVGNYIIGKETNSTARILGSERIPGSNYHRIYLTDVSGNFRFSNPNSLTSRVYFDSSYSPSSPLATGDNAYQYISNAGITLTAQGKIRAYSMSEGTILIDTSYGAFQSDLNISFGSASGLTASSILDVDQDHGEMLGQYIRGTTSGSAFLTFGGNENFGWLASSEFIPSQVVEGGEYRATTRLNLQTSSGSFTDRQIASTNCIDGKLKQTDSTTLKLTTADIVDFFVPNGSGTTGTIHLTNLTGIFNSTDRLSFMPYGSTAETNLTTVSITSIQQPEVEVGSGELLYIENVRPVERNAEQSEEFKIVIGF